VFACSLYSAIIEHWKYQDPIPIPPGLVTTLVPKTLVEKLTWRAVGVPVGGTPGEAICQLELLYFTHTLVMP